MREMRVGAGRGVVGTDIGDVDIFIVSDDLYARGVAAGSKGRNGALRVGETIKYFPEIASVEQRISSEIGTGASVRIFSTQGFMRVRNGFEVFG
ncbi:hypothetical protein [Kribbella sp. NPDC000426]|uniref:hypothetical protein n=1 Tax=Kribbella sp. NPDC000426 TaxID=3154255 RepID=UPI003322AFEF